MSLKSLFGSAKNLLFGNPWGSVFPPRPSPPIPSSAQDGRTNALEVLALYLSELTFFRPGKGGKTEAFNVPVERIFIEWPDRTEDMIMPCIAVVHARAKYAAIGLGSYVEETTRDRYKKGTVLQWMAEYQEIVNLEVWCEEKSERRALLAGIEAAMSPTEQMAGLRFRMPGYFNELVTFTLNRREVMDEPDAARKRRRAQLEFDMRFNVVRLINVNELRPIVTVNVDVDDQGVEIVLQGDESAEFLGPGVA